MGQSLRVYLDDEVKPATVQAHALAKDDLFICRAVGWRQAGVEPRIAKPVEDDMRECGIEGDSMADLPTS